eukprot:scaffold2161_cov244-Pinguiococcus_pyrenoidosus.AAC.10
MTSTFKPYEEIYRREGQEALTVRLVPTKRNAVVRRTRCRWRTRVFWDCFVLRLSDQLALAASATKPAGLLLRHRPERHVRDLHIVGLAHLPAPERAKHHRILLESSPAGLRQESGPNLAKSIRSRHPEELGAGLWPWQSAAGCSAVV